MTAEKTGSPELVRMSGTTGGELRVWAGRACKSHLGMRSNPIGDQHLGNINIKLGDAGSVDGEGSVETERDAGLLK